MFRQRVLSAIVIVIAAIIPAVLGHPILTGALVILAALGIAEFSRAVTVIDIVPHARLAIAISALMIIAAGFESSAAVLLALIILGSVSLFCAAMIQGIIHGATRTWAVSIGAVVYIGLPLAHIPLIRNMGDNDTAEWLQSINDLSMSSAPAAGLGWLVLIVASTWMTDSAAYLGGRAFGSHRLAPALSPGKSVEGAFAGVVAGGLTGLGVVALLDLPLPLYAGAAIGLILSALGQAGDLAESLIKRDLGIKDMGNLIPGHGGILDRIDALLFTLPAGYYLILLALEINWP